VNIQKAIDKLDRIQADNHDVMGENVVFHKELREVLCSLQEPEDDKYALQCDLEEVDSYHQELNSKIEDRLARHDERMDALFNHLSEIEADMDAVFSDDGLDYIPRPSDRKKEPSSVSECKCRPSTSQACEKCYVEPKPTTTPEYVTIRLDEYNTLKKAYFLMPGTPKPSVEKCDTITISRKVAEEWVKEQDNITSFSYKKDIELCAELKLALSNINGKGEGR
jgi:hypothetical protein